MSASLVSLNNLESTRTNQCAQNCSCGRLDLIDGLEKARNLTLAVRSSPELCIKQLSPWSRSGTKRLFDFTCVLLALPLLVPVFMAVALAVLLTSSGPILFFQKRMGRHGQPFTILKFRSIMHTTAKAHHAVTTESNQQFTPIGDFLRRSKLDELPQLLNVLAGHLSLVGPRPKMLEHVIFDLPCRPGITGAATIVFAREAVVLNQLPGHSVDACYHEIILPAKRILDAEYMARATLASDLKLLVNTILRRWGTPVMCGLLNNEAFETEGVEEFVPAKAFIPTPMLAGSNRPSQPEQTAAI